MYSLEEAISLIYSLPIQVEKEKLHFLHTLHRILAQDILADRDMPPFDKSAVDGYACRKEDIHQPLKVIEIVAAGQKPKQEVVKGTCIKIMTGAPIPRGADTVLMKEHVEEKDGWITAKILSSASNIAFQGEDMRENEIIIKKGTFIRPQHIGIFASTGHTTVEVYKQIKVGIVTTGDEIVEPSFTPETFQIRNTNAYTLMALIEEAGAIPHYYGIVPDQTSILFQIIQKASDENELVLVTGGVSEGDFDFVPQIMKELGYQILFDSLSVQPGRPTTLARKENKYIFGLAGNPVSTFVQFHLLVKLLIWRIMGWEEKPKTYKIRMGSSINRKKAERTSFYPIRINVNGEAEPIRYNGSGHFYAFAEADGLVVIDKGLKEISKGNEATLRLI
ncbi:MAG: molybdopterin molybdotransferase MoeA [Bacteroidales bacterium]|nr:molybdopterin molybdotransferase MoeA [Bacteroidales bacterium]